MDKYIDLITNGLDLLSFLLVTPEIVRRTAPASVWVIGMLTVMSLIILVAMIIPFILATVMSAVLFGVIFLVSHALIGSDLPDDLYILLYALIFVAAWLFSIVRFPRFTPVCRPFARAHS